MCLEKTQEENGFYVQKKHTSKRGQSNVFSAQVTLTCKITLQVIINLLSIVTFQFVHQNIFIQVVSHVQKFLSFMSLPLFLFL